MTAAVSACFVKSLLDVWNRIAKEVSYLASDSDLSRDGLFTKGNCSKFMTNKDYSVNDISASSEVIMWVI